MARMTWYVKDKKEYVSRGRELGKVYQEVIGKNYPAMTLVQVADLVEERALVEIEVTAVVPEINDSSNCAMARSSVVNQ